MHGELPSLQGRMDRLRTRFPELGVDAVLFLDMINIRYLTGFTGSDGALLVGEKEAQLLVDGRYVTQAGGEASGVSLVEYRDKREGIAAAIGDTGSRVAGFEALALNVDAYFWLKNNLREVALKPLSDEINHIRAVKDEGEIASIKAAADVCFHVLSGLTDILKPGIRERDVACELEFRIKRGGADDVAFPVIVASGENSALPHARPGMRKIADGDAVVIDYGAVVNGYHCDETCTFLVGRTDQKQKDVYNLVKKAHDLAFNAVRAGVPCADIDRVVRGYIEESGLGPNFSHGAGHGVGLAVHEAPRIAAKSEGILETGMVITLEPGVYFPGAWGVRIEDTVLVKEKGCEVLTKMPKELTIIQ
ncbi:MAG: aminopeptidase P family protein [Deltaproteobacteria bacterium]|nr:aminopeptidase P family protein [Deltaproteobacteria bacterium]